MNKEEIDDFVQQQREGGWGGAAHPIAKPAPRLEHEFLPPLLIWQRDVINNEKGMSMIQHDENL